MRRDRGGSMKVSKLLFTSSQRHATGGAKYPFFPSLDLLPTPPEQQSKQNDPLVLENYEFQLICV